MPVWGELPVEADEHDVRDLDDDGLGLDRCEGSAVRPCIGVDAAVGDRHVRMEAAELFGSGRHVLGAARWKETRRSGPRLVALFALMYFAALRAEEAANLRRHNLSRPDAGWVSCTSRRPHRTPARCGRTTAASATSGS